MFGSNEKKSFDINEKHTNASLREVGKKLSLADRKKLNVLMKDQIKPGRIMRTGSILKTVKKEYGCDSNIIKRIKKGFVNEVNPGLTAEQIEHNYLIARAQQRDAEYQSKENAPRTTYFQPGTNSPVSGPVIETEPDNQTGIFQPRN